MIDRRTFIGGTDVAAILGMNPWRSAMDVWLEKTGRVEARRPETPAMAWGKRLEPVVAQAFSEATGLAAVETAPVTLEGRPFLGGSPDRLLVGPNGKTVGVLEIKTARDGSAWGPDWSGAGGVPPHYAIQAAWYAGLLGIETVYVAALIAGSDLRCYRWRLDRDEWDRWADAAEAWWQRHVVGDEPPETPPGEAARAWTAARASSPLRPATDEEDAMLERLAEATVKLRQAEAELEEARSRIEAAIGEGEGVEGRRYVATWRRNRPSSVVDWKSAALEAGVTPDVAERFTTSKPGARVFRLLPKRPQRGESNE
jgi:putative phage-type endonuclease